MAPIVLSIILLFGLWHILHGLISFKSTFGVTLYIVIFPTLLVIGSLKMGKRFLKWFSDWAEQQKHMRKQACT